MNLNRPTKNQCLLLFLLFIGGFFASSAQEYVPFSPRLDGGNIEIRGDIIFVGNNILNRATQADPGQANTPYNGNDNNNSLWMEYIDIDGDPSTFSSSSAELNVADPACSQVRYAGLYWAGTYPNERSTDGGQPFSGTPRNDDWNQIKFRIPGGNYVDLVADNNADPAGEEDDIITNGYQPANPTTFIKDAPVICYKNVTDLVRSNTNPNGEYTAANVNATRGRRNGSSSAGWVMVVIYENPNESGKYISTFDGYAAMSNANASTRTVDVPINGFRTLPAPFPVRARIGVGALEGDRGIRNDRFRIKASSTTGGFTELSTGQNPGNNFFNSTITTNGNQVPTRTPYGTNTLGTDLDIFNLNNPSNSVIPNGESDATLRFTSTGDGYGAFLTVFAVEIIEPNIILEKRVQDIAGNDITDQGVNLGQTLDYVLSFRNLGNDDAVNYSIRDVLPVNTSFASFDLSGAPGATASVDAATNEVTFSIPNNLVEIGDPVYEIRLRVEVANNCFDFVDACSNQITNLAYSTYQGDINSAVITDDPSVSDFDNCGFVTPGATNFLLDDLSTCNFTRTAQLCGDFVILDAGDGFDTYTWYSDNNNNGQIDSSDTVLNDGDPDSDPSTLVVTDIGTYIVDKIIPDPCKDFQEIIIVERFGSTQTNPIVDYFNSVNNDADQTNDIQGEIVTCSEDGDLLPKIFLCGTNDSQLIQVNITDAQSLSWEKLNEGSCAAAPDDCANKNLGCTWSPVASGNNYMADTEGKYRLVITYTNGCFSRFYFDVFQNNLDIEYSSRDIICDRDGRIRITNLGSNYGYQLIDHANNSILTPFSAGQGPVFDFGSGENGSYRVEVVQLDGSGNQIPGACVFSTDPIGIRDRDFQVDITTTPANCNAQGSIKIDVLNVRADYTYILKRADGTLIDDETAQPDNTYTFDVNPGDYIIETSTGDGCFDSQNVSVARIPDPTLSAVTTMNIGCTAGTIELTRTGGLGNPDFLYAIWSKNGTDLYPNITSIPADAYQVSSTFNFGWRDDDGDGDNEYIPGEDGTYEFVIIDANNCSAFSNPATINDNGAMDFSATNTPIVCSGTSTANLTFMVTGGIGPYRYSIDDGNSYGDLDTFVDLPAGSYNLRVTDASGCDVQKLYTISEPFTLSASAGVTEVVECNPSNGAEVRITNAQGGTSPYGYSFDGGSNYGLTNIAFLPAGTHSLTIRDASGCVYPMTVTVPPPVNEPDFDYDLVYECDGEGTVTVTSDNTTDFDYTYELNGTLNTPDANDPSFGNVPAGSHLITVNYTSNTPPAASDLLKEDFGVGPNTSITEIDPAYCYEPQNGAASCPGFGTDTHIQDGEYSVTQTIINPYGSWRSPNDHTGNANGRFLAINVGGTAGVGGIVYAKRNIEVLANRDITVSLEAYNILRAGTGGGDPSIEVQLVNGSGTIIQSVTTGNIPKNNNADDWINYTVDLNPGGETNLDIVIRTNSAVINGNDIAIDDIRAFQTPLVCSSSEDITVIVEDGKAFQANFISATDISCNGAEDGSITFEVENFTAAGFEYSVDGGAFIAFSSSPVTTAAVLDAGTHRIDIRKVDDTGCTSFIEVPIAEPSPLSVTANVTDPLSCTNGGATITADDATGGTTTYTYQLEDTAGNTIGAYDFTANGNNKFFTGLPSGDYILRVRDARGCEATTSVIPVFDPETLDFTATPTACYSGANDGEILVNVTGGNGGYQFRIDGGAWLTPTPVTADTYTFTDLTNGTYSIEVKDSFGCPVPAVAKTAIINAPLTVTAVLNPDLTCLAPATVTLNTNGGSGSYSYEWSDDGGTTYDTVGFSGNAFTTTADGNYVFRITDTTVPAACSVITDEVAITPNPQPVINSVTPIDILCNGESTGALDVVIDNSIGRPPYTINVRETSGPIDYGTQTTGLPAGDYEVRVTDDKGCISDPFPATISQPDAIDYDIDLVPITCNSSGPGTDPGSITVGNVMGGTAEFTYYLNGNNGFSADYTTTMGGEDHTFAILDFGIYEVDVVDANGCNERTINIIASPPENLDIDVSAATADCASGGTAEVTVSTTILSTNYEFGILDQFGSPYASTFFPPDTAGGPTRTFTGLTPGITYTFVVHDITTDCYYFESAAAPIDSPSNMTAVLDAVANVTCTGADDGNVSFTFNDFEGGATQVDYEIFNFQSNVTTGITGNSAVNPPAGPISVTNFAALAPGIYYVLLTEVNGAFNGCSVATAEFTIDESTNELDLDVASPENDNCSVDEGIITAAGRFGTSPYEYQYLPDSDPAPDATSTAWVSTTSANVESGSYTIYVKDSYGCIRFKDITVALDDAPEISVSVVDECVAEGTFEALVVLDQAGIEPYQISVNGNAFQSIAFNAGNEYTITGLSSGLAQTVEIRDLNGCGESESFNIQPPLQFNAALTTALDCEPVPANNAEITINVTTGSGSYEYEISGPVNEARTTLTSNPFIWSSANTPGNYTVTIYDTSTSIPYCLGTRIVEVPAIVQPSFSETHNDVTCNGFNSGTGDGRITLTETDNGINPLTYSIVPTAGVFNAATRTFENLPADTYTVTGTGTNGCTTTITDIVIGQPTAITIPAAAISIIEFRCAAGNNSDNAIITIDPSLITGGSGSNTYVRYEFLNSDTSTIVQDSGNTSYTETDIAGGNYTINVYDDKGCMGSATARIEPFVQISDPVVSITTAVTCADNDAAIQVSVTTTPATAIPNLEYTISRTDIAFNDTNSTGSFSGLSIGDYAVSVENLDTGCTVRTTFEIEDPNTMEVVITKLTDEECLNNGVDDGSFSFAITDYVGGYNYQVYDINNNSVPGFSGTRNTSDTSPIEGLRGGVYYIRVNQTGLPNCTQDSNAITITAPDAEITANISEEASVTCSNDQGKILVDPAGGKGPYTIVLENTTTSQVYTENDVQAFIFEGLSAGDFHVTVTDAFGCVLSDNIALILPENIIAGITPMSLVCFGGNTASVTADVNTRNVTPIYQYRLNVYDDSVGTTLLRSSAPQTSDNAFDGLAAGFYSITVTDDVSCSAETAIVQIVDPIEVEADLVRTSSLTCTTGVELQLSATGGASGAYEYRRVGDATWTTMPGNSVSLPTSGVFDADEYQYEVRDAANGCPSVLSNTIEEDVIEPLTLTVTETAAVINCNGDNTAVIFAEAIGGLGDYRFELYENSISAANLIQGPLPEGEFDNLSAGTYWVNVTSDDCTTAPRMVVISEPNPLDFTVDVVDITCNGENDGSISVTLSGGAGGYQYAISPNLNQFTDENNFDELSPGDYTIIAQDQNGCFIEIQRTIGQPDAIQVSATAQPEVCAGEENGSIELTIEGGTAPYSTRLSSETDFVQDRTIFSDLASGSYIIFVQDANGCEENVSVAVDPGVNLNASVQPVYGCEGNIPNNYINIVLEDATISDEVLYALDSEDAADMQLNPFFRDVSPGQHYIAISHANGCIVTHEFEIDNYEPLMITVEQSNINELTANVSGGRQAYTIYFGDDNNGSDNTYMINRTDTYVVTVVDQNGCEASANIFIEFIDIEIPNFFSPNGDAANQTWKPRNTEGFPDILTIIFDRYGREVYRIGPNGNGWDGFYQQTELPTGDYWYIIKLNGENDDREFVGHFTLYR